MRILRWLREHVSIGLYWSLLFTAGRMYYDGWHYYLRVGPLGVSYAPAGGYGRPPEPQEPMEGGDL